MCYTPLQPIMGPNVYNILTICGVSPAKSYCVSEGQIFMLELMFIIKTCLNFNSLPS